MLRYDLVGFNLYCGKKKKKIVIIINCIVNGLIQWVINTQGRYKGGSHGLPPRKKKNTLFSLKNQNPTINLGAPL